MKGELFGAKEQLAPATGYYNFLPGLRGSRYILYVRKILFYDVDRKKKVLDSPVVSLKNHRRMDNKIIPTIVVLVE